MWKHELQTLNMSVAMLKASRTSQKRPSVGEKSLSATGSRSIHVRLDSWEPLQQNVPMGSVANRPRFICFS
jgi:hypothetical protein